MEENFSFLQKDKIIDVSEEGDLLLGKIIDNKKIIFLTSNSNDRFYDIIMNDKIIQIKTNKDEVLSSLRKKIRIKNFFRFCISIIYLKKMKMKQQ